MLYIFWGQLIWCAVRTLLTWAFWFGYLQGRAAMFDFPQHSSKNRGVFPIVRHCVVGIATKSDEWDSHGYQFIYYAGLCGLSFQRSHAVVDFH